MKYAWLGLCWSGCVLAITANARDKASTAAATRPQLGQSWHALGGVHVRDGAEKDLAVLRDGDDVVELRQCAECIAIRLRHAELWMSGDKRQKLWLPLALKAGKRSNPISVRGGPIRVTHVALEDEALGLGTEGAHFSTYGRTRTARKKRPVQNPCDR